MAEQRTDLRGKRNVRLVGGPWDGDTVEFQAWQTYIDAPDHTREYASDGRYVLAAHEQIAVWQEVKTASA